MEDGTLVEAESGGQRCPPRGWLLKIVGMSHQTDRARWYSTEGAAQKALAEFRPASHGTQRESARVVEVVPSAVPGIGRAAFALAVVALAAGLTLGAPAMAYDPDEGRCGGPPPKPYCPKGQVPEGMRCRCGVGDHPDWCQWETVCVPKPARKPAKKQ